MKMLVGSKTVGFGDSIDLKNVPESPPYHQASGARSEDTVKIISKAMTGQPLSFDEQNQLSIGAYSDKELGLQVTSTHKMKPPVKEPANSVGLGM